MRWADTARIAADVVQGQEPRPEVHDVPQDRSVHRVRHERLYVKIIVQSSRYYRRAAGPV